MQVAEFQFLISLQQGFFHQAGADDEAAAGVVSLFAAPAGGVPALNGDGALVEDGTAEGTAELVCERVLVADARPRLPGAAHRHDSLAAVELSAGDDGGVVVADVVGRDCVAVNVADGPVGDVVFHIVFLQADVSGIALVAEHFVDSGAVPFRPAAGERPGW